MPAGANPKLRYMAWAGSLPARTSSVSAEASRSMASRHSASISRVPMPQPRHERSTEMVVTCPSVTEEQHAGEPDDGAAHLGHEVAATALVAQLAHEQPERPAAVLGLALDAQHGPQVASPHRHQRDDQPGWIAVQVVGPSGHHPVSRVVQLISASGLRRYIGVRSHGLTNCSRRAWAWASITSDDAVGWASSAPTTSTLLSPSKTSR